MGAIRVFSHGASGQDIRRITKFKNIASTRPSQLKKNRTMEAYKGEADWWDEGSIYSTKAAK
jgi:hypothetical protein